MCCFLGNSACTQTMFNLQTPVSPPNLCSISTKSGEYLHSHYVSHHQLLLIGKRSFLFPLEWEFQSTVMKPDDALTAATRSHFILIRPGSKCCQVPTSQRRMVKMVTILTCPVQSLGFCSALVLDGCPSGLPLLPEPERRSH